MEKTSHRRAAFQHAVDHAKHVLPDQGPIANFIHHNTLHAFQSRKFAEALEASSELTGAEPYWTEAAYRDALKRGRIDRSDIDDALNQRGSTGVAGSLPRRDIERFALMNGIEAVSATSFAWREAERDGTRTFRSDVPVTQQHAMQAAVRDWLSSKADDKKWDALLAPITAMAELRDIGDAAAPLALWALSLRYATPAALPQDAAARTLRDAMLAGLGIDIALEVNAFFTRFIAAYLDEGIARWSMPDRAVGMLGCARVALAEYSRLAPAWLRVASRRLSAFEGDAAQLAVMMLDELGVPDDAIESYVARTALELPGYFGLVARLERVPADRVANAPQVSTAVMIALRLLLLAEHARFVARQNGLDSELSTLQTRLAARASEDPRSTRNGRAVELFHLAQLAGLTPEELETQGRVGAEAVLATLDAYTPVMRRRSLHEAYELHYAKQVTSAVAASAKRIDTERPRFQVVFCMDDREEAIRRHFEARGRDHVTFGVAGFFGVAMTYRPLDNVNPMALCPVIVTPQHTVMETPVTADAGVSMRRTRLRRRMANGSHAARDASRSLARGSLFLPVFGFVAAARLALTVLWPHFTARLGTWFADRTLKAPRTVQTLKREEHEGMGFTVQERADRVATTLENIGLTKNFAPLIAFFGHGASTVNNPHQSAYDCGACGGRNGGPNGRAFAMMANDPEVRSLLTARNIVIPDDTWFTGGLHDTTNDAIVIYDQDAIPERFHTDLEALREALDASRHWSAHERCRKFEHAPAHPSLDEALHHVEERAVDLSQARPELGHATNATAIIGRRLLSRDIFLDRRAFLISYDASIDPSVDILERILGAVVPVGAGINLEYFFSTVDDDVYGAGTKLPHNVVGLLGVSEGFSGDLRTGLPRQMTEIHEPMRLLCIIEATPEAILQVAARRAEVAELVGNEWVRVFSIHPETGAWMQFTEGAFVPFEPETRELPRVAKSVDWYAGTIDFLPPARIAAA